MQDKQQQVNNKQLDAKQAEAKQALVREYAEGSKKTAGCRKEVLDRYLDRR